MERMKIGVDVPFFVWMSDFANFVSYLISFGSLVASMWLVVMGVSIHWSVPTAFAILTVIFKLAMSPYVNTKQQLENIVKENDGKEEN